MLAKVWKKALLIILIIACLFNLIVKLSKKVSFDGLIDAVKAKVEISQEKDN